MQWLTQCLRSNVGRKAIVGITGIALVLFVIMHLFGNLTLYAGAATFNHYAELLEDNPLLPIIEIGLALMFLGHIVLAIRVTWHNRGARGESYKVTGTKQSAMVRLLASKTMIVSGGIVLLFLVVHIWDFRLHRAEADGHKAAQVVGALSVSWRAALYTIGSLLAGWHLGHGFQSALRSLGFNHPKYTPFLSKLSVALGAILALGFASLPVWIFIASRG